MPERDVVLDVAGRVLGLAVDPGGVATRLPVGIDMDRAPPERPPRQNGEGSALTSVRVGTGGTLGRSRWFAARIEGSAVGSGPTDAPPRRASRSRAGPNRRQREAMESFGAASRDRAVGSGPLTAGRSMSVGALSSVQDPPTAPAADRESCGAPVDAPPRRASRSRAGPNRRQREVMESFGAASRDRAVGSGPRPGVVSEHGQCCSSQGTSRAPVGYRPARSLGSDENGTVTIYRNGLPR